MMDGLSVEPAAENAADNVVTRAVTGAGTRLVAYKYRLPDDSWEGWSPQEDGDGVADAIGRRLADGPAAQELVRASVLRVKREALSKRSPVVGQGVWVPDRSKGRVAAVLDVGLVAARRGPLTPERHLSRSPHRDFGRTTRIIEHSTHITEVPAGRMTVKSVLLRRRRESEVQSYLLLDVFAKGAVEAFSFMLNTVHLELVEELARQGRAMADSLQLTLGDLAGGRMIE